MERISGNPDDVVRRGLALDNFVNLMKALDNQRRDMMLEEKVISPDAPDWTGLVLRPDYEYDEKAHTGSTARSFLEKNRP